VPWSDGEHQEKVKRNLQLFLGKTPPFRSKPVKNFDKLHLTITFLDIRILALQVKNPVHNVRLWHTGMTRSLEFSRIRAPWSHNQGIRTERVGNLHRAVNDIQLFVEHRESNGVSHPVRRKHEARKRKG
jgi:hypothetical protein